MNLKKTTFSIATIVYNDASHILETIDSVISQTHKDIEYILIDGASTDGTREAIFDYLQTRTIITREENSSERLYMEATHSIHPTLTFKFLSQKDEGIYDAMNKGIALATKEWINFMNCGDKFYDSQVLEKIAKENIAEFDVVYGDTEVDYGEHQRIAIAPFDPHKLHYMFRGFCHQSFFIKTKLHQKYPFDLQFKIASDYNTILTLYVKKYNFKKLNLIFSSFLANGLSAQSGFKSTRETFKIAKSMANSTILLKIYLCNYPLALSRRAIKVYMPQKFTSFLLKIFCNQSK